MLVTIATRVPPDVVDKLRRRAERKKMTLAAYLRCRMNDVVRTHSKKA
jgi:hypothetical protein